MEKTKMYCDKWSFTTAVRLFDENCNENELDPKWKRKRSFINDFLFKANIIWTLFRRNIANYTVQQEKNIY
ncbi:hypothetical protein RCL_jg8658.t1 [Rhizophagus clarus]|uniref:Uncharacterized protein n=1 Tax=Rhizophagus clarus TaxID=94130 RepID=A0A8H3M4A7_9GLOM|nr:hypothetical protein RCL_jg8658.t1 [Rhizophagus clarus]